MLLLLMQAVTDRDMWTEVQRQLELSKGVSEARSLRSARTPSHKSSRQVTGWPIIGVVN